MIRIVALGIVLAGCGASRGDANHNDANLSLDAPILSDGPPGCSVVIAFDPLPPIVAEPGLQVFATAQVIGASGVLSYVWTVTRMGTPIAATQESLDNHKVSFDGSVAGSYQVTVMVNGPTQCPDGFANLNVMAPGANVVDYRLRVVPPPSLAPPQESVIQIHGGATFTRAIALDPGLDVVATVKNGSVGVQAYVRFVPVSAPTSMIETFSDAGGSLALKLLGQSHQVLVVPAVANLAPVQLTWTPGVQILAVGPGTAVSGIVKDPAGIALAGATVQLSSGGVPSTLATTAADGSFTVRTAFVANAQVTATVTPPAGRGLPRLTATAAFDLMQSLQIRYAASLATCDLAATPVQRGGANQPNAKVMVVGPLAAVGTVTAGATASATGVVRIAASADATGKLPSTLVPRAQLSAVIEVAAGDLAVATLDTTGCAATTLVAPAMTFAGGTTFKAGTVALGGVRIEATPAGALALAGEPPVVASSASDGTFSIGLATGGTYDVRFSDPRGRAAPLAALGVAPSGVPSSAVLPVALLVTGGVSVAGSATPVDGASVQILCASCTGLDAERPIAEAATDATSTFAIAVPDPGTM